VNQDCTAFLQIVEMGHRENRQGPVNQRIDINKLHRDYPHKTSDSISTRHFEAYDSIQSAHDTTRWNQNESNSTRNTNQLEARRMDELALATRVRWSRKRG
jgi:hypothetical protein